MKRTSSCPSLNTLPSVVMTSHSFLRILLLPMKCIEEKYLFKEKGRTREKYGGGGKKEEEEEEHR